MKKESKKLVKIVKIDTKKLASVNVGGGCTAFCSLMTRFCETKAQQ